MATDTDQLQLYVTRSHNLATIDTSLHEGSRSVAVSATANYTVWTPIVTTVAIRSHNCACLLTPIVGEGNGTVKVANNGIIVQKWPVAIAKRIS